MLKSGRMVSLLSYRVLPLPCILSICTFSHLADNVVDPVFTVDFSTWHEAFRVFNISVTFCSVGFMINNHRGLWLSVISVT